MDRIRTRARELRNNPTDAERALGAIFVSGNLMGTNSGGSNRWVVISLTLPVWRKE